jgi:hypothetical protein
MPTTPSPLPPPPPQLSAAALCKAHAFVRSHGAGALLGLAGPAEAAAGQAASAPSLLRHLDADKPARPTGSQASG